MESLIYVLNVIIKYVQFNISYLIVIVQNLAKAACERVSSGEIVSFAEGLVEGLLHRGEGGVAAGIALSELFRIRGPDIPRANLYLVGKSFTTKI